MTPPKKHRFRVSEEDAGLRIDQVLARCVPDLSRGKARRVLALGGVFVDRRRVKVAGRTVRAGQWVELYASALDEKPPEHELPSTESPRVLYRDEWVVVVDKPTNLPSAPTRESDRHDLRAWLARQLGEPIYVVHRLDRPTSGLIVFARERGAAARLNEQLRERRLVREYLLAVDGQVSFETQTVTAPVADKPAHTDFRCVTRLSSVSLLSARLATGRTHQIRVHAAHIGHPVSGDHRYGQRGGRPSAPQAPRLALHAAHLEFLHPTTSEPLAFDSEWPADLAAWWDEIQRTST